MLSFRLLSDLHQEFSNFTLPLLETDKDDVLVLAGDIGVVNNKETFAVVKSWIPRFKHTIMILGNHEFYHSSLIRALTKQKEIFQTEIDSGKLSLVNNEVIRVEDVSFVCGTLWTDFNKGNPLAMEVIRTGLNDYKCIRTGNYENPYIKRITPHDIRNEHIITKNFIFNTIAEEKAAGQYVVVVSHHAPCELSIDRARYGTDPINFAYASDLSNEILDTEPNIWVHGHCHTSFDYMVGNTRIVVNPRGYAYPQAAPENRGFDPTLRIEVKYYGQ